MTNQELKLTLTLMGLPASSSAYYDFEYKSISIRIPVLGRIAIHTGQKGRTVIRYSDPAKALKFIERYMEKHDT